MSKHGSPTFTVALRIWTTLGWGVIWTSNTINASTFWDSWTYATNWEDFTFPAWVNLIKWNTYYIWTVAVWTISTSNYASWALNWSVWGTSWALQYGLTSALAIKNTYTADYLRPMVVNFLATETLWSLYKTDVSDATKTKFKGLAAASAGVWVNVDINNVTDWNQSWMTPWARQYLNWVWWIAETWDIFIWVASDASNIKLARNIDIDLSFPHPKTGFSLLSFWSAESYTPPSWKVAYITVAYWTLNINWITLWTFWYSSWQWHVQLNRPLIVSDTDVVTWADCIWFLVDESEDIEPVTTWWEYEVPAGKIYIVDNMYNENISVGSIYKISQKTITWSWYYNYHSTDTADNTENMPILMPWDSMVNANINHTWFLIPVAYLI
jgi:hypothetical protein